MSAVIAVGRRNIEHLVDTLRGTGNRGVHDGREEIDGCDSFHAERVFWFDLPEQEHWSPQTVDGSNIFGLSSSSQFTLGPL